MEKKTIELLAPAGSWEALEAAVNAGADAVYMGGKAFGARAYASNFDEEEMAKAVYFAHMHHVRLYITVNTLVDDSELEAFKTYCKCYPKGTVLLVDTYNVLKSGVPNAIKAFDEVLKPMGCRPVGIRIDSGDITYLSKKARKMLDEAGYPDCKICASNALDEYLIRDMIYQGAKVDMFGVGERLITAKSEPVFGGVYKLAAVEDDEGNIQPKIKISENVAKITTPHFKKLYRIYDKNNHKAVADLLCVHDEVIDESRPLTLFDPQFTWKKKVVTNFEAKPIQQQIFKDGKCVYKKPAYEDIVKYAASEIDTLWDEITRFENPHTYYVDLSQKLWEVKNYLLAENNRQTAD